MQSMFFIRGNLAVCGFAGIGSPETFQSWGFTAQLQCAEDFDAWIGDYCQVKALPFHDGYPIPPRVFASALDWLMLQWKAGGRLLISCAAGQSRSVSLATALLAKAEQVPFSTAAQEVLAAIPAAYPHPLVLVSASVYSQDALDFDQLKELFEGVRHQPPFPWSDDLLRQALDYFQL